jgi:two-component system NtrC family sensor kinase
MAQDSVTIGILHSLSGTMAISESALVDAELLAVSEINAAGGVLGQRIHPLVVDGASETETFATQARYLITQEQVKTIFGCWTSATRKAILPIVEALNTLLWYPVQYEGLEASPNIFYTGICPNQQVEPAVDWLRQQGKHRFYLLGSDYVFPRTVNKIIKAHPQLQPGEIIAETYVPLGTSNFQDIIDEILQLQPDVVFSTLNGDSNLAFYRQYHQYGISAEQIPILAVSVAEGELRELQGEATGHYAAWSYFQSLDLLVNQGFVERFQRYYGQDRVTSDPIEAAYTQVYLWKAAVEKAQSFESDLVRSAARGLSWKAPGGTVTIEGNNHISKPCRIGKILENGQFELVYETDLIQPLPWLGMENINHPMQSMLLELLGEVPQGIQYSCEQAARSRTLEILMNQVIASNQQLKATQAQLLETEAKNRQLQSQSELLKHRLHSQIRDSLDSEIVLKTAVEELYHFLELDRCQFLWYTDSGFDSACVAADPDWVKTQPLSDVLGTTLLQQQWLFIDTQQDGNLNPSQLETLAQLNLTALLSAMITTHTGCQGILICEQYQTQRTWTQLEIELLQTVVDQLAIAINQAQLYEQAQTQATQLQQALQDLQETQGQLVHREKMSSLGELIAGVAHEINNPTNFIFGNLQHVQDYTQDLSELLNLYQECYPEPEAEIADLQAEIELDFLLEDLPKTLKSMQVGANRIRDLVHSLRNFSRQDVQPQITDLHTGLDSTLMILNNRLKPKGSRPAIKISKDYGDIPKVECFPGEINQVFMNLIGNSIDALDHALSQGKLDQPHIQIQTRIKDKKTVTIRIQDNGLGIPQALQDQIFNPFFTTKPVGQGTGLGLAISQRIILEKHGGKLTCLSIEGQLTEFVIELPTTQ